MKKFLFSSVLLLVSLSCRKSYTCECSADDPVHNVNFTSTMTRSAAEDWCREWDNDITTTNEEEKAGWRCVLREE